ncbi:MAG: hypothetical protein DRP08_06690, partial [Candidatus Aenigmatarchaeota archaeon]
VNGNKIGTLENTVPNGHYFFYFDPSLLNYAKDGAAKNSIILDSPTMNRGYYISSSGVDIIFCLKDIEMPVVASNQEEANEIIMNLSDLTMLKPDFGVYTEDITFSNTKPSHGEEIIINVTIYNLGTLGTGPVTVQLLDNLIKVGEHQIYLPAFGKETVSFTWSSSGGSHRISVKLNPDRTIEESYYTNNEAYKDITVTPKTDFTPPEISNVQALDITTNSATITWDTDELSNSLVKYGETPGNYTLSKSDSSYVLKHNLTLTGLKDNTTYYYIVNSTDKSDNSAESSEHSFTTFPIDTTPPASVEGLNETDKGTTWILWKWIYPFEPDFSHTMVYINGMFKANVSAPKHSFNATGLKPNTTYEIGTRTVDVSGNINITWVNDTATTFEDREPPASITNLRNTTGPTWINWTWDNPTDADFNHTMVYLNGIWKTNTSYPFYNATELIPNTYYEIGTHTVDTVGNVNETWVNQTTKTHALPKPRPSIDVEKTVWDQVNETWAEQITAPLGHTVTFNSTIHNDGECCNLTHITVSDTLSESLKFVNATPEPDEKIKNPNGTTTLIWKIPGPLAPCNSMTFLINATLIKTGVDTNVQNATAWCDRIMVTDEDTVTVNSVRPEGGVAVAIRPKVTEMTNGSTVNLSIYIVSTENFNDVFHVFLTNESIPPPYRADMGWFNWTEIYVPILARKDTMIPLRADIPAGAGDVNAFKVVVESTKWSESNAFDIGIFVIS